MVLSVPIFDNERGVDTDNIIIISNANRLCSLRIKESKTYEKINICKPCNAVFGRSSRQAGAPRNSSHRRGVVIEYVKNVVSPYQTFQQLSR